MIIVRTNTGPGRSNPYVIQLPVQSAHGVTLIVICQIATVATVVLRFNFDRLSHVNLLKTHVSYCINTSLLNDKRN